MKKILLISFVLPALLSTGCKKNKDSNCSMKGNYSGAVKVIKDCTGTYIRYKEKDYKVCNEEVLKYYTNSSLVTVSFNKITSCPDQPLYICNMYHENEGFITISCLQ